MSSNKDQALAFFDTAHPPGEPGAHVLIIGVGKYGYGKGLATGTVSEDLRQLTSPPISARAIADWFIGSFRNQNKPLASVSLLISEDPTKPYQPSRPSGAAQFQPPSATLANVKEAARNWAERLSSHKENMGVFYFCGHGASLGQQAALLLEDFGLPGADFDNAIDVDILRGTMKNSPAIQQLYLVDCCRTNADELYKNEPSIGSRIVSVSRLQRGHSIPPQQFVLFPTIDGEEAFGIKDKISVFSNSLIDAMSFAGADDRTGLWLTNTASLFAAVDKLVRHRVPESKMLRSKPNALDATSFDFNEIDEPTITRSFVTISDKSFWGKVELECVDPNGATPPQRKHSKDSLSETCCMFGLNEGRWRFKGSLPASPPQIQEDERTLRVPVAYVELKVTP